MIAHVSIGVSNIDRSKHFYDTALEPLGYRCLRAARSLVGYGYGRDRIAFWVFQAERPVPADEKSGLHFCFTAPDPAAVDAFHATAMAAGGTTMVRPVCVRFTTPTTTPPSSSIQTDIGSRHISVQPKPEVSHIRKDRLPRPPNVPKTARHCSCRVRRPCRGDWIRKPSPYPTDLPTRV